MSWSCPSPASLRIALSILAALLALGFVTSIAQEGDSTPPPAEDTGQVESAEPAPTAEVEDEPRVVHEVIIDDSGIVLREGDDEIQMDLDRDENALDIKIRSGSGRIRHEVEGDEQVSFGEDVVIEADEIVHNDMVIIFGDLRVHGKVVGDIVVVMGDVNLYDGAEITGDIVCVGGEVDREPGAEIIGEITPVGTNFSHFFENDWDFDGFGYRAGRAALSFGDAVWRLVEILILALVGQLLLSARVGNMSEGLRRRPGYSFLVGLLTLLAAILLLIPAALVIILVALTVVGIPVAILAILGIVGLGFLGWLLPLWAFSRYTFEARGLNRYLSVSIWAGIFWLVHMLGSSVSTFGLIGLVEFVVFLFGIGALVLTRLGARELASS